MSAVGLVKGKLSVKEDCHMLPRTNTQKASLLKPLISQPEEDSVSSRQPVGEQGQVLVWDRTNSVFYDSCDLPAEVILEFRCKRIYSCVKECVAKLVMHSNEASRRAHDPLSQATPT